MPDNTSDLVALTQFLENASSVTVVNLQTAVDEAGERLLFLLEYATLPCMLAFLLIWYFLTYWLSSPMKLTREVSCNLVPRALRRENLGMRLKSAVAQW